MSYLYKVSLGKHMGCRTDLLITCTGQGMAAIRSGSDVSGSVLLTWHEKVCPGLVHSEASRPDQTPCSSQKLRVSAVSYES